MKVINKIRLRNLLLLFITILIWTIIYKTNLNKSMYRISPILDQTVITLKINNFFYLEMLSAIIISMANIYTKFTIIRYKNSRRLFQVLSKEVILLSMVLVLFLGIILWILGLKYIAVITGGLCLMIGITVIVFLLRKNDISDNKIFFIVTCIGIIIEIIL